MTDIILAECGAATWLVAGERHMGDLMQNTLGPGITLSIVACGTMEQAMAMWAAGAGADAGAGSVPWMINPAIVGRIKRALAPPSIAFTPWSAMLDADAEAALSHMFASLAAGPIVLRQFSPAEPPPGLADLQRLRAMLASAALQRAGADPAALRHETLAATNPGDEDRLDLVGHPPTE